MAEDINAYALLYAHAVQVGTNHLCGFATSPETQSVTLGCYVITWFGNDSKEVVRVTVFVFLECLQHRTVIVVEVEPSKRV